MDHDRSFTIQSGPRRTTRTLPTRTPESTEQMPPTHLRDTKRSDLTGTTAKAESQREVEVTHSNLGTDAVMIDEDPPLPDYERAPVVAINQDGSGRTDGPRTPVKPKQVRTLTIEGGNKQADSAQSRPPTRQARANTNQKTIVRRRSDPDAAI